MSVMCPGALIEKRYSLNWEAGPLPRTSFFAGRIRHLDRKFYSWVRPTARPERNQRSHFSRAKSSAGFLIINWSLKNKSKFANRI